MRERPILFSAPMVRALLAGTKTQTRRVCKPQPDIVAERGTVVGVSTPQDQQYGRLGKALPCPYGQPGDRLWVREAWRTEPRFDATPPRDLAPEVAPVQYEAGPHADVLGGKLRPGMFMPRWASRINLEVLAVRVERLQDISDADARAEGITQHEAGALGPQWDNGVDCITARGNRATVSYRRLWESINRPGSWDSNPWVWVVSFRRV
ncbi:MAG: hypothetical protein KF863_21645 [Rubrivivax sp.]|nr:hypothetical protein [Rubrivivax sp.]